MTTMEHNSHVQNHPTTAHTVEHTPLVDRVIQKIGHAFDSPHAAGSTKTTLGLDNAEHSYPKATGGKRDPNAPHKLTKDFGAAQTGDYGGAVGNPKPEYNTMGIAAVQQELAKGDVAGDGLAGAGVGAGAGAGAAAGAGPAANAEAAHHNEGLVQSNLANSRDKAIFGNNNDNEDGARHLNIQSVDDAGLAPLVPGALDNATVTGKYTEKTDPSLIKEFDHPHPKAERGEGGLFDSHSGEPGGIKGDHHIPGL